MDVQGKVSNVFVFSVLLNIKAALGAHSRGRLSLKHEIVNVSQGRNLWSMLSVWNLHRLTLTFNVLMRKLELMNIIKVLVFLERENS
jgi:hypothetical protein